MVPQKISHIRLPGHTMDDNDTKYKLLPNEGDESDESILTVRSITADRLVVEMLIVEDDMTFQLNLDRIN